MDLEIDGNAALVTASSSGLGKASAEALVREGVHVMINGRDETRLEKAVDELKGLGPGEVIGQPGDLTKKEDIEDMVERTYEEFGRIDHLVTCAGGPPSMTFMETKDDDWYLSFDLLVMSVVRVVMEAVDYLKQGDGGTIVNITSISVKESIEGLVLSNSVRMSVIGLMKTLSKELGPEIRANAVLPGPHETARIRELINVGVEEGRFDSYQEGLDFWNEDIPLERIGSPSELGDVVAFLCSKRSSYLDGVAIPVDGGGSYSNL